MRLKHHGAFRTGSNYLRTLLELNYEVELVNGTGGFKHAPVPALFDARSWVPPADPILGTVKDVWSWLPSMWRYTQDVGGRHVSAGPTWERFLVEPMVVSHGGYEGFPSYRFASAVDYWNAMGHNLVTCPAVTVVRYEDALAQPERTCEGLATTLSLHRRSETFAEVPRRTRNLADRARSHADEYLTDQAFDPAPYREQRYLEDYSDADRSAVVQRLDAELMGQLGYALEP